MSLGKSTLLAILEEGYSVNLVITLRDESAPEKSGRVFLDDVCGIYRIPLVKVDSINDVEVLLSEENLDWMFVVGWSQIIPEEILRIFNYQVIGAHPTLLPQGRGRAPIPWAIIKKLSVTGVSFFKMDNGVDSGPIIYQESIELSDTETATTLYASVTRLHKVGIKNVMRAISRDQLVLEYQDESRASYWPKRTPSDGVITSTCSLAEALTLVRALTRPYPGARVDYNGKTLVIWKASVVRESLSDLSINLRDGIFFAHNYEFLDN